MRESRTYGFCEGLASRGVSLLDCSVTIAYNLHNVHPSVHLYVIEDWTLYKNLREI